MREIPCKMAEKSQNAGSRNKKINKKEKTIQQQKGIPTLSADLKYSIINIEVPRDVRTQKVRRHDKFRNEWSQH